MYINKISIGDILLNKDTNIKYLVVDKYDYKQNGNATLCLREYAKVKKQLDYGIQVKMHTYNDYTIEINGMDLDENWDLADHIDIEIIKYFRLRGLQV